MGKKDSILKVKNLGKKYSLVCGDEVEAIKNVSFDLQQNEILGMIGRSGGGKTTLIRILRGVEDFDEGEILFDSESIRPDSTERERRKIRDITAIHLQRSFGLWADSAKKNVMKRINALRTGDETAPLPAETSSKYQELEERSEEILEIVDLGHKSEHHSHTLSGGQKQRLVLARQIATAGEKSKILLLDEPVTMTCPETKQMSLDWIKKVSDKFEVSILLASHLPQLIDYLSDRAIWLEKEIRKIGEPKEVIDEFLSHLKTPVELKSPPPSKKEIIRTQNLTQSYHAEGVGKTFEMKGVDLKIFDGETLGIIGPSGVGKTVLIRLLSGLELPQDGKIIYNFEGDENDITDLDYKSMEARRQVGVVHQELGLTHDATVRDLAAARLGMKGEGAVASARKKAKELGLKEKVADFVYRLMDYPESEISSKLEEAGLDRETARKLFPIPPWEDVEEVLKPIFDLMRLSTDLLDRKSQELSGGEKIRIAVALELLSRPKVLFLDEPFGDLDPLTLRNLANSLKLINKEFDTTIVLVSHHLDFVKEVSHRIVLMKEGEIVDKGNPEEIKDRYVKECKAEFMET